MPSATGVGVPEVIDEWVSAPYPEQQAHRHMIVAGLRWLDTESQRLYRRTFVDASATQQIEVIEAIAYPERPHPDALAEPIQFFGLLRSLVTGAFFSSPEGARDLGYIGNTPIAGDYPGPTKEAMDHLQTQLRLLGLTI